MIEDMNDSIIETISHVDWARQRIDAQRRLAYADPLNGSDTIFAESARMQAMGESGWEEKQQLAIARYNEIQQQHPWPVNK